MLCELLYFNVAVAVLGIGILPHNSNISWNILPQFPDYMLIIHFDNDSHGQVDNFFEKTAPSEPKPKSLFNYDTAINISRPVGYKFLNLVFLRRWKEFVKFSSVEKNIKYEDIILFVTKVFTPKFDVEFYYKGIELAGVLFIYVTGDDVIYTARFYNDASGVLREVAKDQNGVPNLTVHLNNFKDFENFNLRVAFSNCDPYIYKSYIDDSNYVIEGAEFKVLNLIAEMLNFKTILHDFSDESFPRTEMINAVHNRKMHLAIGCISNTISRNAIVEFTSDIKIEVHTAIYSSSGYRDVSFFKIVTPFETDVWIYLMFTIALVGLLIKKITDYILGYQDVDFLGYLKIPYRNIVEQSVKMPSNKIALRIICATWFLAAMIITNSYKSKLASSLIKPTTNEPESLAGLVSDNFGFLIPANDPTFLKETLENSNDKTFKAVLKRWNVGLPLCESLKKTLQGRYAVIDEMTSIKFLFWNKCPEILTQTELSTMRVTKYSLFPNSHVWAMQKTAPFKKRFTTALALLQSTGIIQKWYNTFNLTRAIRLSNQQAGYEKFAPLDVETVFAPFIILVAGIVLSIIFFAAEIIRYKKFVHNVIDFTI